MEVQDTPGRESQEIPSKENHSDGPADVRSRITNVPTECLVSACICAYLAANVREMLVGYRSTSELLCLRQQICCNAADLKTPFSTGILPTVDDEVIIDFGLYCCTTAIIKPKALIRGSGEGLCFTGAASLPFDKAFVPRVICAICFVKLLPSPVGACAEIPSDFKKVRAAIQASGLRGPLGSASVIDSPSLTATGGA
jgi:hypothetical protein